MNMKKEDNTKEFAEIDYDREKRTGFPEVIYGETKTPEHSAKIAKKIYDNSNIFLITRTNDETYQEVLKYIPEAKFDSTAKMIWSSKKKIKLNGSVSIVSAGTSDIPVPKPIEVGTAITGLSTNPATTVGKAPSIPATTTMQSDFLIISIFERIL